MTTTYYIGILILLSLFAKSKEGLLLIIGVILLVSLENTAYEYISSIGGGFYSSAVFTEFFACILLITTYKLHKSILIIIPFILGVLLNMAMYWWDIPLNWEDPLYYWGNTVLYELMLLICINETNLPSKLIEWWEKYTLLVSSWSIKTYLYVYYYYTEPTNILTVKGLPKRSTTKWSCWYKG